ncbi:T9SS type A sorting domain-containing protein [Flammeovirga sp. MY04]|uniref:fibronectin type III domain-containing protein n=1 Tax=Flammeovirga sp. MY04 TaxID=1191459 RepID=UPI0008062A5C|nr:fibronectin type III domain-containing protein [Flammeovirga sp. MY04]ANQ52623.1 T9SS type A sorting domain-containing protein [Flammeovirga sp. MY04]
MKVLNYYLFVLLFFSISTYAQDWQQLNPGAGGRVQGVSCDPSTPGRMFVASDMEGFYYSNDYGTSWNWSGKDLPTTFVLKIEGRGNKFFVGHAKGLSKSTNKGSSYTLVQETADKTIGVIEIDPSNTNNIYAGINWRGNDGHLSHYPQETTDTKQIWYSHDGGNTWNTSSWANFGSGDPRVQSIQVLPTNSNHVYIATSDGLYKSTNKGSNWSKVNGPSGIDNQYCWGADFTKDGKWIYALYRKGGFTRLFAQNIASGTWTDLGKGAWDSHNMWEPLVYQDDNSSKHYVLVSQRDQNPNEGLFEAEVSINGSTPSASFQVIMYHNGTSNALNYDIGWNYYVTNNRNKTYYPGTWNNTGYTRGVFTQSQQSYFTGDAAKGNADWRVVSTGYVKSLNGLDFYRSRGTASTFTYDVAGIDNYLIQGQADNLALESWDNGGSWVQSRTTFGVQDGHGVHVIPSNPAIVLMDAAAGFGGGNPAANSNLLYKVIDKNAPDHNWQRLAFGTSDTDKKGLPKNRIWQFHADPNDYKRLYVITHTGLYLCDDIVSLINTGAPYFRKIHTGSTLGAGFSINSSNTNEVYYKDNSGVYKGTRNGNGEYSWTQMTRSSGQTNNLQWGGVAVINKGGNKYVYTYERYKGIVRADNGATQFGASAVLWDADLFNYLEEPAWYDPAHHIIQTSAMYADGDDLYITYHVWEDVRWGYGIMKGTVQNDGSVNWQDWTSDLHYSTTKQIKKIGSKLYVATQGSGIFTRKLNGGQADALPPIDEQGWESPNANQYFIFSDAAKANDLSWDASGNVLSSFSSGQAIEGTESRYVEGLDQSVAPGADHSLVINFSSLNASGGTLNLSAYGIGGSLSNINIKIGSTDGGYHDVLNNTISANSWSDISIPLSGGTFDATNFNKIIIERWGGGVSKFYLDKIFINGTEVSDGTGGGTTPPPTGNGDCDAVSSAGKPNPPCQVWVESTGTTTAKLHWNDNSDNETYFDIQAQLAGDTYRASGMPDGGTNATSVDISGLVENGTYTFRIKAVNGNGGSVWVETDQVTLGGGSSNVPVSGVTLSDTQLSIEEGNTDIVVASVLPNNASNTNVTYSSNNTSVASVNNSGLITAVNAGTAVITVTTQDGGFTDQVNVTVTSASIPPTGNGDCSATSGGGKPNPPCGVWVEATSATTAILHWNDNSDNETYFDIQAQLEGDSFRASGMPDGAANGTSVEITGLIAGAKYIFRIKAVNGSGGSVWVETDQVQLFSGGRLAGQEHVFDKMVIAPNPSNGQFIIQSDTAGTGFIVNQLGVKVSDITWQEGSTSFSLSLASGMYVLISNDSNERKKLIIR